MSEPTEWTPPSTEEFDTIRDFMAKFQTWPQEHQVGWLVWLNLWAKAPKPGPPLEAALAAEEKRG